MWPGFVRARLPIVLLLLSLFAFPLLAQIPIHVNAPPEYARIAQKIRAVSDAQVGAIARFVGAPETQPVIEVAIATTESSLAKEMPQWVAGYAMSEAGVVVLIPSRTVSYPDDTLEETYLHELAHVLIERAAGNGDVPRWFHEGVATVAGKSWSLEDRIRMSWEALSSRGADGRAVDRLFRSDERSVHKGYVLSESFVRDMLRRYGPRSVARILTSMRGGDSFNRAFFEETGRTPERAWAVFWETQSLANVSIPVLASSGALWLAITIVALVAVLRKRHTNALQVRVWELEEELQRLRAEERSEEEETPPN